MILEGIVTTLGTDGALNVAPMGPIVDSAMDTLVLRPFKTSTTWKNLSTAPQGVFHVIDDVLLIARAAIGRLEQNPETTPARVIDGAVLCDACRWYEFLLEDVDVREDRTRLTARVVHRGRLRDFFGFNRAKHAVLEAAILATRVHILPKQDVWRQIAELRSPLEKTAGPDEVMAFALIIDYIEAAYTSQSTTGSEP